MSRRVTHMVITGVAAVAIVLAMACSRPKPVVAPEMSQQAPEPVPAAQSRSGTTEVTSEPTVAPAQSPEAGVSTGELPTDLAQLNQAGYLKDAFFDTDKSELRADARDALAADGTWLRDHPSVKIMIEGHCDERNTAEYNLALGWRRANAAKDYLVTLGINADRIATISYGEEKPFANCHEESCWWQNRRAHLVITAR
ncbi:MAG: peptidoglycan-associated lipoprotein Pal [Acidobacteriota bacterium]